MILNNNNFKNQQKHVQVLKLYNNMQNKDSKLSTSI